MYIYLGQYLPAVVEIVNNIAEQVQFRFASSVLIFNPGSPVPGMLAKRRAHSNRGEIAVARTGVSRRYPQCWRYRVRNRCLADLPDGLGSVHTKIKTQACACLPVLAQARNSSHALRTLISTGLNVGDDLAAAPGSAVYSNPGSLGVILFTPAKLLLGRQR